MWLEILFRFLIGGAVISAFSALGSLFKPKSFAGLFGAAPSVALATLGLTVASSGPVYAAIEARSMTGGVVAFLLYTCCVIQVMMRLDWPAWVATTVLIPLWLAAACGLWLVFLR